MYIQPRWGENSLKLLFCLIQLIGSTRPKFDVWRSKVCLIVYNFVIGFSKKIEKIIPGNAFEQKKKKPGLK